MFGWHKYYIATGEPGPEEEIPLKPPRKQPAQAQLCLKPIPLWGWHRAILCRGHRCHPSVEKELLQRDRSLYLSVKWWIAIQSCQNHTAPEIPSQRWEDMVYCPPSPHIKGRLTLKIKYGFWSHWRQSVLLGPVISFRSWLVFYSVKQEIS